MVRAGIAAEPSKLTDHASKTKTTCLTGGSRNVVVFIVVIRPGPYRISAFNLSSQVSPIRSKPMGSQKWRKWHRRNEGIMLEFTPEVGKTCKEIVGDGIV